MVNMIIARWVTLKILFIFLFPWIVHASFIHNLDVRKERVFTNSPKSYFGYSLSAHRLTETPAEYISTHFTLLILWVKLHKSNSISHLVANRWYRWLVGSPGENLFQGAVYKCNTSVDLEAGFLCKKVRISSTLSGKWQNKQNYET